MEAGAPLPSAAGRAVASLSNGSGRTLVIAGPPTSGKSALLGQIRTLLRSAGVELAELRGAHRDREAAYALVAPLADESPAPPTIDPADEAPPDDPTVPMAAIGTFGEETGRSRRARGERQRGTIMGVSFAVRTRGVREMDPSEYWRRFCEQTRSTATPGRALLVDDGGFADAESRDYLLYLIERARYRPLLLVLVLDSSDPAYGSWEEKLIARGDVDWIRFTEPLEDPREASRFRKGWEQLPDTTRRILGYLALLQGSTTEVTLSRVSRLPFGPLADALLPATEANLVRVDEGKVTLRHAGWSRTIPELLRPRDVREFHREIADALEAMHREPTPARRRQLAEHYFHWEAGPTALRYLLEAAELAERSSGYDDVVEILDQALLCIPGLPPNDRPMAEVELRLFRARALLVAGRPAEAESEMETAVTTALHRGLANEQVEEWLEAMVASLVAVGPRPGLLTVLGELADRCEAAGLIAGAVLLEAVVAVHEIDRGHIEKARHESRRAGHLARRLDQGPAQALAMLSVGLARVEGEPEEERLAAKFLTTAHRMFAVSRRADLQQLAEELRIRLISKEGHLEEALQAHERAVRTLQRLRLHSVELPHQLGIAELILRTRPDDRAARALKRARELVELLHLVPPSPALYQLWLLEAWHLETVPDLAGARERLSAIDEGASGEQLPRLAGEARLRLARIELSEGHEAEARRLYDHVPEVRFAGRRKPPFDEWSMAPPPSAPAARLVSDQPETAIPASEASRARRRKRS